MHECVWKEKRGNACSQSVSPLLKEGIGKEGQKEGRFSSGGAEEGKRTLEGLDDFEV